MSVVYTQSAIKNGEIPSASDFEVMVTILRQGFEGMHKKFAVEIPAATIFGGVASGRVTLCSDIDILVLVDDRTVPKDAIFQFIWGSKQYIWALQTATKRHIQVAIYPVALSDLRSKNTRNDKQFLGHVCGAARGDGLLCGDAQTFRNFLCVAPENNFERTVSYIDRKIEKIEQRLFSFPGLSESEVARMYLDTYQAPFHALRRYFDLIRNSDFEDSKEGLIRMFSEVCSKEVLPALVDLNSHWKKYVNYIGLTKNERERGNSPLSSKDTFSALFVLRYIRKMAEKSKDKKSVK